MRTHSANGTTGAPDHLRARGWAQPAAQPGALPGHGRQPRSPSAVPGRAPSPPRLGAAPRPPLCFVIPAAAGAALRPRPPGPAERPRAPLAPHGASRPRSAPRLRARLRRQPRPDFSRGVTATPGSGGSSQLALGLYSHFRNLFIITAASDTPLTLPPRELPAPHPRRSQERGEPCPSLGGSAGSRFPPAPPPGPAERPPGAPVSAGTVRRLRALRAAPTAPKTLRGRRQRRPTAHARHRPRALPFPPHQGAGRGGPEQSLRPPGCSFA